MMSERNGIAAMSKLSWSDSVRSDDPRSRSLDGYGPYEAEPLIFERFFDRIQFLRLGGYPFGAAIIGAWRMGMGKPVFVNYPRGRAALLDEFGPPTPSQMLSRLGLLLVISLGFALVAGFLV
jgi:hypothetical protein